MPALKNAKHDRFYVYRLIDPRTAKPFYVGKGCGRRAWAHERAERAGREPNGAKAEALGGIRRAGLTPIVEIVEQGLTEIEALRLERAMIFAGKGSLANIALGNRSPIECMSAAARNDLAEIKPFCALIKEGASAERLGVWARVTSGLSRIAAAA